MTKAEWGTIVKKICDFYPKYNFMDKQDTFDAWYELLSDLEAPATMQAVKNLAKENQYPPHISDIRNEYNRMYENYKKLLRDIRSNYEQGMSFYPNFSAKDDETYQVFLGKLKEHPQKEWLNYAVEFRNRTIDYVRETELQDKTLPDYREYINEL